MTSVVWCCLLAVHSFPQQFRREVNISLRLDHPNVVRLLDVAVDTACVYLIQELAQGGDLFDLVCSLGALPERRACGILRQLVSAVNYCHSMSVFHRDIKMENILLVTNDADDVKLTDFGLAKDCIESFEGPKTMQVGTISFMAPEIAGCAPSRGGREGYDGALVDVWGLGCTLFVMTTGEFPFGQDDRRNIRMMLDRIRQGGTGIDWEWDSKGRKRTISHPLTVLLQGMLSSNPVERLAMTDVVASEWVQGDDGYTDVLSQAATTVNQQVSHGTAGGTAVRTIELWPEGTHSAQRPSGTDQLQSLTFDDDGVVDLVFDSGSDVEDSEMRELVLEPVNEESRASQAVSVPATATNDAVSVPATAATATSHRARTVHFASSPRFINSNGSPTGTVGLSRFHCSPVDEREPTDAALNAPRETPSIPTAAFTAQQQAASRVEQEAMDRLLAERLADAEHTDQHTLQVRIHQECKDAVLIIPDGLECPITNELFEDPVMCTDGKSVIQSFFQLAARKDALCFVAVRCICSIVFFGYK